MGAFTDLESIVIDLDLIVTALKFAILFPGELYRFALAGFEVYRYFGGIDLIAIITGGESA